MVPRIDMFLAVMRTVSAYPWVANTPDADSSLLGKRSQPQKRESCPFNPNHPGAAPYNSKYLYTGARNGLPGNGKGGILGPASGRYGSCFHGARPEWYQGAMSWIEHGCKPQCESMSP